MYVCMCALMYVTCTYTLLNSCTFEGNHRLVDGILLVRAVGLPELGLDDIDDGENLLQAVVPGLIPQRQAYVVNKVQVPRDLFKAVTGYTTGDELISELGISGPVVPDLWEVLDSHQDMEPNVRS